MLNSVLDQVQKLFSRSFAIASFVPSLLLVAVVFYTWFGYEIIAREATLLTDEGWQKAGPEALMKIALVYLIAYVIYGVRGALHHIFQGRIPQPLSWLSLPLIGAERLARRRRRQQMDRKNAKMDVPNWVLQFDFGEKAYSAVMLKPREATALLKKAQVMQRRVMECLRANRSEARRDFQIVLADAFMLQANRHRLSKGLQDDLTELVAQVKQAYHEPDNAPLRETAGELRDIAYQEWLEAYNQLMQDFPDDPWLQATRLGNVTMVLETYTLQRYGISLGELWPRLNPLLDDDTHKRIEEANTYLDFTVIMSFCSLLAALAAIVAAFEGPERNWTMRILLPVGLILSFRLFYRLAIEATRAFGVQIQAAVDLNRLLLFDKLGIDRPQTVANEQVIWAKLHSFFAQAEVPQNLTFSYGSTAANPAKP